MTRDNRTLTPARWKKSRRPNRDLLAVRYWSRVPDGEYLAFCTRTYWDRYSRAYGERIYIHFRILDGPHAGIELRLFCRPSKFPSSNYYRFWSIAHDGPPRSRSTRLSPKIFEDKIFRVRTATVRPRHRIVGPDGKVRFDDPLPEHLWYSKVECILSLEVSNEACQNPGRADRAASDSLKQLCRSPFQSSRIDRGRVGRRKLGAGNGTRCRNFQGVRGGTSANNLNPVGGEGLLAADPTPASTERILEEDKRKLRRAIDQLHRKLDPHIWETWLRPAQAAGRNEKLKIGVPNESFVRAWKQLRIDTCVEKLLGEPVSLVAMSE